MPRNLYKLCTTNALHVARKFLEITAIHREMISIGDAEVGVIITGTLLDTTIEEMVNSV